MIKRKPSASGIRSICHLTPEEAVQEFGGSVGFVGSGKVTLGNPNPASPTTPPRKKYLPPVRENHLEQLTSGGQTGADRAVLEICHVRGIFCGGWVPKGRLAEDGRIDEKYTDLIETPTANYLERTEWNVRDTDGTIILTKKIKLTGGSMRTRSFCKNHDKPWMIISKENNSEPVAARKFVDFVVAKKIKNLNVAGPRESKEKGVYSWAYGVLSRALDILGAE